MIEAEALGPRLSAAPLDAAGVESWALAAGRVWRYDLSARAGSVDLSLPGFTAVAGTALRILWFPAFGFSDGLPDWSSCLAAPTVIVAGESLSLADQHGHSVTADQVGCVTADQWNLLDLDLSRLAGRRIDAVQWECAAGSGHGWLQVVGVVPRSVEPEDVVDRVRTTRGSNSRLGFSRGNTYPLACMPHGFNFLTPVTDARARDWLYTYQPDDKGGLKLQALAFAHAPSPWIADRSAFQLMPWTAKPRISRSGRALAFSHDRETDRPFVYRVELEGGITASVTPTAHAAVFRFEFGQGERHGVILDQPYDGRLTMSRLPDSRLAFRAYIAPSQPSVRPFDIPPAYVYGETLQPAHVVTAATGLASLPASRRPARWWRRFRRPQAGAIQLDAGTLLEVKVALSFISVDQARRSLAQEIGDASFERIELRAGEAWRELLGRLEITGGNHHQRVSAWSNLARLLCWPNAHHENLGTADAPDWAYASPFVPPTRAHTTARTGCEIVPGELFVNNGYWDTYRTCWPAMCLLTPDLTGELLDGIAQQYRDGGWMARWVAPGYVDCMVGTSSDQIFATAAAHHISFDELTAYDSALKDACLPAPSGYVGRKGLGRGRFVGYIDTDTLEGMSWALDNAQEDDAIARWSASLAERADSLGVANRAAEFRANAVWFANRALSHQLLFDQRIGFHQGRRPDGSWRHQNLSGFDPRRWGDDYTETNAWGMQFAAPHDGHGLAVLMGGEGPLGDALDAHLQIPETATFRGSYGYVTHEMIEARSLRLGMLGMSNQPAHHVPYMYLAAGQPWRTQWLTREILDRLFLGSEIGQGYPGDEDNGEMSAWWLLSALGLYPLHPASGEWVLTAPLFEEVRMRRSCGDLVVRASGVRHRYIQSVRINGEPWQQVSVPVGMLMTGVTIDVDLGPEPSDWGSQSRPVAASLVEGRTVAWQPDRSSSARIELIDAARTRVSASSLVDDRGETVLAVGAGSTLSLTWATEFAPRYLTLTADHRSASHWTVEIRTGQGWQAAPVEPRDALWPNQTQAYLLPPDPINGVRWSFTQPMRLRQVEVI